MKASKIYQQEINEIFDKLKNSETTIEEAQKQVLCKIFGHRWSKTKYRQKCNRCKKFRILKNTICIKGGDNFVFKEIWELE